MPSFESPALYIDFSRLPPPNVIENIAYEKIVAAYKGRILEALPVLERALKQEQSPQNVMIGTQAYGEMMVRQRINAAARAVMLPFAQGADLDVLAAFYNLARDPIVPTPRSFLTNPEDWESDERFRSRCQMAPEAFSMAGTAGSYRFHAMSAEPTLRDASAMKIDDMGGVLVTLMGSGTNPRVSTATLNKVRNRLLQPNIKPLTDVVSVGPAKVKSTRIVGTVTLYPGPGASAVMDDISKALVKLRDRVSTLGRDLTRSAIIAALSQEGVLDVKLTEPEADILCGLDECVLITAAIVDPADDRRE